MSETKFKGINDIGEFTLSEQYKVNLKTFLDWAFLEIGAFTNVSATAVSPHLSFLPNGTSLAQLTYVDDPNYTAGTIWQIFKHDIVWESGIEYIYQPVQPSEVYINGTSSTLLDAELWAFRIDYPNGRVIFENAHPITTTIALSYSYRYYNVYIADNVPGFKELVNTLDVTDLLTQSKVHLPCIIIELVADKESYGLQLGGGQWVVQDVLFHVYSMTKPDRDKAIDILCMQKAKTLVMFNNTDILADGKMPLDAYGSLNDDGIMYPQMITDYLWKKVFIKDSRSQDILTKAGVYRGVVRYKLESDFPNI